MKKYLEKLAKKGGHIWFILGIIPSAMFVKVILDMFKVDKLLIIQIQLPLLFIQIFAFFMLIKFRKIIFNL